MLVLEVRIAEVREGSSAHRAIINVKCCLKGEPFWLKPFPLEHSVLVDTG